MRIGIFTDTYPPYINGVSTSIAMLEKGLKKLGHQVYIVTVNNEKMSYKYENNERIIRIPGIPIGIYDYRLTGIYPIKIVNKIKNWNLDVIHSHTEFGVGTFARIISKQFGIPLVHTYHTMYEDYVHYITKGYFDKSSKKIVEYLTKFYCDKTASELIVPSKKTYDLFKEKYKFDKNIHIIPTGIDVEKFYAENQDRKKIAILRKKIGITENDFVMLYVGRLAKEKNVEFLIDNHIYLSRKYKNLKLLIVGNGPDYNMFVRRVQKLKIDKNVIFTGAVPYDDISNYYAIADIFVTASNTETQGLTVIEAMASSLPVVCIDDASFNTIVINDLNGYTFKKKRQYKIVIEKIIRDNQLFQKLKKQARITAEQYSLKYFSLQVLDVYKRVVKSDGSNKKFINRIKKVFKDGIHGR